ncbi:lytic transglycosylase domain-containing protein [Erythrobacter sp.]|uniref:lytic transglycosylase domain-containing protein n=1 Tax=Erythrobacter sp. TaxID=1042 RepID=UPI003C74EC6B
MSTMPTKMLSHPTSLLALASASLAALSAPTCAQSFDNNARTSLVAQQPSQIGEAIARWEMLQENRELSFAQYAGFALRYPDFPRTELIRLRAEAALEDEAPSRQQIISFFDTFPPLTNSGRASYALSLAAEQRSDALEMARAAWRGGEMSAPAEAYLLGLFGSDFTAEDHAERMNALLWQGNAEAASRQMINVPPVERPLAMARLSLVQGSMPQQDGLTVPTDAMSDAGYVHSLVNYHRSKRQTDAAIRVLANRPAFDEPAFDAEDLVGDMLAVAEAAGATSSVLIASKIDDLFAPGTDISAGSFRLRDRYTDLMWLGGTNALWEMGDGSSAAPLFYRYGNAARTPLTRSKGFYWAGRAARQAGQSAEAERYFDLAARYPHQYYGQLALGSLGRPMPEFEPIPQARIEPEVRAEFEQRPVVKAIRALADNRRDWRTERRFFQALGESADTPEELTMIAQLAADTGLDEMAVVLGMEADENGIFGYERLGFPTVATPTVRDWTLVHAIARQESEFDRTRQSHAGARGLMQLMPGTAREQAGKLGVQYMAANLYTDPAYNIRLGDAYFQRMLNYYDGSYPLALGAYNAGPGRVNQWLRLNGDPRTGAIDYQTWIEKIPSNFETRYYIMRVLGNAVTYSHMYPEQAGLPRSIDAFLR